MKTLRYAIEGALVWLLIQIFRLMTPEMASGFGGWIGRSFGPHLGSSKKALQNLQMVMAELSPDEYRTIIIGMWDNLGRVIAEYPHLETLARDYTVIEGKDILHDLLDRRQQAVYISGHMANWELNISAPLVQMGIVVDLTYREPNNPWTAKLLHEARTLRGRIRAYPKSRESGRSILQSLKDGRSLGILIDQKYNEGVESLFFGQPAMTNPIFVQLCQKYKCPLIPARVVRENGCHFRLHIHPEIPVFNPDGSSRAVSDVIADVHTKLEGWIREKPDQWMWVHQRWKS